MFRRLWIYQRERFPLAAMSLLALAVGSSAVLFSALARDAGPAQWSVVALAAVSVLLVFVQMRVLDEHKDFADDSRYRPYRAVPRGLVSLAELRWVLAAATLIQLGLAITVDSRLVCLLLLLWAYLALMSVEFFVRDWLRPRAFAYLASHNPFGALIVLYAASFEWLPRNASPHGALLLLAAAVFFSTALLEIGRKIRAPQDEEHGVVTYSAAWGRTHAVLAWCAAAALTIGCGLLAALQIGHGAAFALLMAPIAGLAALSALRYLRKPETRLAKAIEGLSGITSLALYAALGPVAVLLP